MERLWNAHHLCSDVVNEEESEMQTNCYIGCHSGHWLSLWAALILTPNRSIRGSTDFTDWQSLYWINTAFKAPECESDSDCSRMLVIASFQTISLLVLHFRVNTHQMSSLERRETKKRDRKAKKANSGLSQSVNGLTEEQMILRSGRQFECHRLPLSCWMTWSSLSNLIHLTW